MVITLPLFRAELAKLTDEQLVVTIVSLKRAERELGLYTGRLCPLLMNCWYETLRRDKESLFDEALRRVAEEERRHRAGNHDALLELKEKR